MTRQLSPAWHRGLGLFTALASLALTSTTFAQAVWTGSTDNEFSNSGNWSPSAPSATDSANVSTGSPQVTTTATVGRLGVEGGNVTITNSGDLTVRDVTTISSGSVGINQGGTLRSDVDLNGGSLFVDGTLDGRLKLNNGSVTVNGEAGSADVSLGTALSNNGNIGDVSVSSGGTFTNNNSGTTQALTNTGTSSNAGTIGSVNNTAGNFTNNAGGRVTGATTVAGGTVTNNFIVTSVDVAAAAAFVNNSGATAGAIRNSGTVDNAGTIASLQNHAGSFTNNVGGRVTGMTTVNGGTATNNFIVTDVDVAAAAAFVNNLNAEAGNVHNSGSTTNAGTVASLRNEGGTFTNNAGGEITGNTVISGGTVTNNFIVTDVDVAAAAAFVNNSGARAGAVANSGTVTNAGEVASLDNSSGTFTNNTGGTVTGITRITGGAVVNNADLSDVDIRSGGRLTNNSAASAGTVRNEGDLANDGTVATLVNAGGSSVNTGLITGTASVTGGEFVNQGTVAGQVDVAGGTLSGNGNAGSLLIDTGGVLSPGPGIETINVSGDVTFRSGSLYQVDVGSMGTSDRVNAGGVVRLDGGTLNIASTSGPLGLTNSYTILTGSGISGTFEGVTSDFAFFTPNVTYGGTGVNLDLDRNSVRFSQVARSGNDRTTADAVEALPLSNALVQAVFPLDVEGAANAFSQLNGELHETIKSSLIWESRFAREATIDNAAFGGGTSLPGSDDVSFWSTGSAGQNRFSSDGIAGSYDYTTTGVLFGADTAASQNWRIGGVVGFSRQTTGSASDIETYQGGLYARGEYGPLQLLAGTIYSRNMISTKRQISFGSFSDVVSTDYDADVAQVFGDLSWRLDVNENTMLQPFINLAYIDLDTSNINEKGGPAALSAFDSSTRAATSTIGIRWSTDLDMGDIPVVASGVLSWRHTAGRSPSGAYRFDQGSPFVLDGVTMPNDTLVVKAGLTAKMSKATRVTLTYFGEFGSGFKSSAANANLVVDF
ncbi:autotransporter domain-containing protein [Agrobacterium larrymoorei]|uniref:autotransporter outer membrane beta-barrel domain-containing protein n=1 Tax=Agrobacterium larrymoorei TaxID=160699 RepID=UPI001572CA9E|nr:autotransporter domain-containing protein [Agrobacterium larrymoorei]NTJ43904.1 autotransporter domain-containing protein [Agrobacterium larrymoorei]